MSSKKLEIIYRWRILKTFKDIPAAVPEVSIIQSRQVTSTGTFFFRVLQPLSQAKSHPPVAFLCVLDIWTSSCHCYRPGFVCVYWFSTDICSSVQSCQKCVYIEISQLRKPLLKFKAVSGGRRSSILLCAVVRVIFNLLLPCFPHTYGHIRNTYVCISKYK